MSVDLNKLLEKNTCGDCGAAPGQQHEVNCDVARCPLCGMQDLGCAGYREYDDDEEGIGPVICTNLDEDRTDGDMQLWTGVWPGVEECVEFGWFSFLRPPGPGQQYGTWEQVGPLHPEAGPDLNRLITAGVKGELRWDRERSRWVLP